MARGAPPRRWRWKSFRRRRRRRVVKSVFTPRGTIIIRFIVVAATPVSVPRRTRRELHSCCRYTRARACVCEHIINNTRRAAQSGRTYRTVKLRRGWKIRENNSKNCEASRTRDCHGRNKGFPPRGPESAMRKTRRNFSLRSARETTGNQWARAWRHRNKSPSPDQTVSSWYAVHCSVHREIEYKHIHKHLPVFQQWTLPPLIWFFYYSVLSTYTAIPHCVRFEI